jgi:hypothetical protein
MISWQDLTHNGAQWPAIGKKSMFKALKELPNQFSDLSRIAWFSRSKPKTNIKAVWSEGKIETMPYRSEQIAGKIGNSKIRLWWDFLRVNSVQNKHNLYYKRIFRCIRGPAKSQMTFDLQTILVQDQTFHLCNHAQEVIHLSRKLISRLYDPKGRSKRCHIDLNKLRVKLETVKDSTLVRLPPSEDTFKQHVLRSLCNNIVREV